VSLRWLGQGDRADDRISDGSIGPSVGIDFHGHDRLGPAHAATAGCPDLVGSEHVKERDPTLWIESEVCGACRPQVAGVVVPTEKEFG
jgi:hypothetical protein